MREILKEEQHFPSAIHLQPNSFVNLYSWSAIYLFPFIENETNPSLHNGDVYFVDISINNQYPFIPPKFVLMNKINHQNIDDKGLVKTKMLSNRFFSPALRIKTLVEDAYDKLMNPELELLSNPMIIPKLLFVSR